MQLAVNTEIFLKLSELRRFFSRIFRAVERKNTQKPLVLITPALHIRALVAAYMPDSGGVEITQHFGTIWPAASALADIMARRCIVSDEKLLRSADRLR